jgi:hypothetical protein
MATLRISPRHAYPCQARPHFTCPLCTVRIPTATIVALPVSRGLAVRQLLLLTQLHNAAAAVIRKPI